MSAELLDHIKALRQKRAQVNQAKHQCFLLERELALFEQQHPAAKGALDAMCFMGPDAELLRITEEDGKALLEISISEHDERLAFLTFAGYDGDTGVWETATSNYLIRCRVSREVSQLERHIRALWDGAKCPHCKGVGRVIPTDFPAFRRAMLGVDSQASRRRRAAP